TYPQETVAVLLEEVRGRQEHHGSDRHAGHQPYPAGRAVVAVASRLGFAASSCHVCRISCDYIFSGALTPRMPSPLASVCRAAQASASLALRSALSSTSTGVP